MKKKEAFEKVVQLIEQLGPHDRKETSARLSLATECYIMSASWERARGVDCRLTITTRIDAERKPRIDVDVNWSSCGLTPVAARAAARLHADVADLACAIEAALGNEVLEL